MAKQRRLMHEALDDNLDTEARIALQQHLAADPREADHYDQLQRVDHMLRTAPSERAPRRLAMQIMSRLAEALDPEQLSRISGLALALGLALVTIVMIPVLVTAGWLLLNGMGSAVALTGAIQMLVGVLTTAVTLLETVTLRIQGFLNTYPAVPVLMIALIPLALVLLRRSVSRREVPLE